MSLILGIITGLVNGFFGAGGGTILVPGMERLLKIEEHKAHATAIAVILPISLISGFVYIKNNSVPWGSLMWVVLGGVAGGFTGAKLLSKIPKKWLHIIFGGFMIASGVKMIL